MISREICQRVLGKAVSTGADYAELFAENTVNHNISMIDSRVESIKDAVIAGAAVRVYKGLRSVMATTVDTSEAGLMRCAEAAADALGEGTAQIDIVLTGRLFGDIHPIKIVPMTVGNKEKVDILKSGYFAAKEYDEAVKQVTGTLLDVGVDTESLYSRLYLEAFEYLKFKAAIYERMQITPNGVAWIFVDKAMQAEFNLNLEQSSAIIGNLDSIRGCISWIAFIETGDENGAIRVRLRSRFVHINTIAEKEQLQLNYRMAKQQLDWIDRGLQILEPDERLVLEGFYISTSPTAKDDLMDSLCIERSALYELKDRALRKFTIGMYGMLES